MEFMRKQNRLDLSIYKERRGFFFTIATYNRSKIFTDSTRVSHFRETLRDISQKEKWLVHAYCFMPDHFHLLIEPKDDNQDAIRFISKYKQLTGFWYKQKFGQPLWQRSFHDHVLRKEEDVRALATYTLENPQKDGLVQNWRDYPFLGSFVYDLDEL